MYVSRFHFDRLISSVADEPPSDVHFHPPGSLRLPAQKTVTPMNLLTKMVEHHIWKHGITDLGWGGPMKWVAEPSR